MHSDLSYMEQVLAGLNTSHSPEPYINGFDLPLMAQSQRSALKSQNYLAPENFGAIDVWKTQDGRRL